jgi:hypothetical protein
MFATTTGRRRRVLQGFRAALFGSAALAVFAPENSAFAAEPTEAPAPEPPPIRADYVQYGVMLSAQTMASHGDVCSSDASTPCILGSGGGLGGRVGYRGPAAWYFGGAYEFSQQDASELLRLPILQQLRAEARYEATRATSTTPYLSLGAGAIAYGNEWGIETGGMELMVGIGLLTQLSRTSLFGASVSYRPLMLRGWTDSAGVRRADRFAGFGMAHLVTLELTFEVRSPLSRW